MNLNYLPVVQGCIYYVVLSGLTRNRLHIIITKASSGLSAHAAQLLWFVLRPPDCRHFSPSPVTLWLGGCLEP